MDSKEIRELGLWIKKLEGRLIKSQQRNKELEEKERGYSVVINESLEQNCKRFRTALEEIANIDYRGNGSPEMAIAKEALKED